MGTPNPMASGSATAAPTKRGLYGTPELSPAAKLELSATKLPKDHKVEKFDMTYVEDLLGWIETTESAFETAGIKEESVMVRKALDWMTPVTRDVLKGIPAITKPNWEGFKKTLKGIFLDAALEEAGSRSRLEKIVDKFDPIGIHDRQKMNIYRRLFGSEAEKLMSGVPLISNADAIRLYLAPIEVKVRGLIKSNLQKMVKAEDIATRRREDPYTLDEVMSASLKALDSNLFDLVYDIETIPSTRGISGNTQTFRRGPISMPFAPEIPEEDTKYLRSFRHTSRGIKEEDVWADSKRDPRLHDMEENLETIANIKDTNNAIVKEMKVISSQFKEGMSFMNQLSNIVAQTARAEQSSRNNMSMPTVQQLATIKPNKQVPMTLRQLLCYMCKSPEHMMGDCPHYKEYMARGWLVQEAPGSKRVMLRDGIRLPREDATMAIWQKIEQIARERGWDHPSAYFANMEEDEEEEYEMQLSQGAKISAYLSKIEDMTERLAKMEMQREEDMRMFAQQAIASSSKNE